jgi:hypothetical protein
MLDARAPNEPIAVSCSQHLAVKVEGVIAATTSKVGKDQVNTGSWSKTLFWGRQSPT